MFDHDPDRLIPLRDVPRLLPKTTQGKRIHISAVYRWVQRGVGGRRLGTLKIGGTRYTTPRYLEAFTQRDGDSKEESRRKTEQQKRRIDSVRKEVDLILGSTGRTGTSASGRCKTSSRGAAEDG
jgi:hypothetical protein